MSIVILGGSLYSKNRGINALTRSTLDILKNMDINKDIILNGFTQDLMESSNDYTFVPSPRFFRALKLYAMALINKKAVCTELLGTTKEPDHILVLDLSGGDSFTDIYGYQNFLYQITMKYLFKKISNEYILLPQTIGPFNNKIVELTSRAFLEDVEIMVRDNESKEYINRLVKKDCIFCYDLAFTLRPKKNNHINISHSNRIGINVSGLLWMGGFNRKNQFNFLVNYQELMTEISEYFLKKGWEIVLVPHTYGNIEEDDLIASKALREILKDKGYDVDLIDIDLTEQEIKDIISKFEFFIGSRMHACIAALSSSVPALAVSYSKKFRGVFKTINAESFLLDPRFMNKNEMLEHLDLCFENRDRLREDLKMLMPQVRGYIFCTMKEEIANAVN